MSDEMELLDIDEQEDNSIVMNATDVLAEVCINLLVLVSVDRGRISFGIVLLFL